MLIEMLVAERFMSSIQKYESHYYASDSIKDIYNYFKNYHDIELKEYIPDFINCSGGCESAKKELDWYLNVQH